ncbi:HAD hydrolase-like protein [Terasakiella sp. A23]|uniref:HAD family hydrolase n=1 Tax=Terasakiella sp. FCG-A23 TaxID=3080561 RepID=UPI0029542BF6|nr:HAD hydrolase-like protein [Terasakiella sp. A23]MDV7340857.1 HAD hydrolase-like protein [Terasakiella sp. A23]
MSIFDQYESWVFDFDGVILDSNNLKTEAFHQVALPYGKKEADALCTYHVAHGGISRFVKFEYFFETILGRAPKEGEIDQALDDFAKAVTQGMLTCRQTPDFATLMEGPLSELPCTVISGSMQAELRNVMDQRGILKYFDNVFGSPDNKDVIFKRECDTGGIKKSAVYIGDSLYDYKMASKYGLDFIFAYDWTEFKEWKTFFSDKKEVRIIKNLSELKSL